MRLLPKPIYSRPFRYIFLFTFKQANQWNCGIYTNMICMIIKTFRLGKRIIINTKIWSVNSFDQLYNDLHIFLMPELYCTRGLKNLNGIHTLSCGCFQCWGIGKPFAHSRLRRQYLFQNVSLFTSHATMHTYLVVDVKEEKDGQENYNGQC